MAWSRFVPQAAEFKTPEVYCWKTAVSASTVTETGCLAIAALSYAAEFAGTVEYELTLTFPEY
jgi:predicted secreted protein